MLLLLIITGSLWDKGRRIWFDRRLSAFIGGYIDLGLFESALSTAIRRPA
jgi:hypothetical protein